MFLRSVFACRHRILQTTLFYIKILQKNSWKALRTMHLCFTYECAWIKREYAMIFFRKFNFWNFDGCFLKLDSEHFGLNVNFKKETEVKRCNNNKWKKRSQRCKHCAMAVVRRSQKFRPHRPLPGGAGRPKFNHLEMVTTFTYRLSLVKIDARDFELS